MGEGDWGCGGLGKRAKVSHFALVWPQRDLLYAANLRLRNQQTETSACVKAQRRTRASCCRNGTNYSMDAVIHLKNDEMHLCTSDACEVFTNSRRELKAMLDSPLHSKHLISRCININLENIRLFKKNIFNIITRSAELLMGAIREGVFQVLKDSGSNKSNCLLFRFLSGSAAIL